MNLASKKRIYDDSESDEEDQIDEEELAQIKKESMSGLFMSCNMNQKSVKKKRVPK